MPSQEYLLSFADVLHASTYYTRPGGLVRVVGSESARASTFFGKHEHRKSQPLHIPGCNRIGMLAMQDLFCNTTTGGAKSGALLG